MQSYMLYIASQRSIPNPFFFFFYISLKRVSGGIRCIINEPLNKHNLSLDQAGLNPALFLSDRWYEAEIHK